MLTKINHRFSALLLKPKNRFLRHALVQLVVLLITMDVFWDDPVCILPERFSVWVPYFLLFNAIIYVNMYLLVPCLLLKGRAGIYLLSSFLLILGVLCGIGVLQSIVGGNDSRVSITSVPVILDVAVGFISLSLTLLGVTTLQLFKYRMENREKIDALKNATMTVELANLQNQINPHFLFNMLNNANIMAGEDAEKSSFILTKMKDLLRYQIEEGAKESVKLKDDIAFLDNYLALEALRRDRFFYNVKVDGNADVDVPPLLFIPFVENAVKHNPGNDSFVKINFKVTSNRLYFACENPKAKLPCKSKPGGIGLVNIKKRLDLLFGKHYQLDLTDEEEVYTIKMEIKI